MTVSYAGEVPNVSEKLLFVSADLWLKTKTKQLINLIGIGSQPHI